MRPTPIKRAGKFHLHKSGSEDLVRQLHQTEGKSRTCSSHFAIAVAVETAGPPDRRYGGGHAADNSGATPWPWTNGERVASGYGHRSMICNKGRGSLRGRQSIARMHDHSITGSASPGLPVNAAESCRFVSSATVASPVRHEHVAYDVVQLAVEQERHRIARDIHDHVGQHLVGIMLRLAALEHRFVEPSLRSSLGELCSIIVRFGEELKAVSAGKCCGVPSGNELVPALKKLLGDWGRNTGITTVFECRAETGIEPSDAIAEVVYRGVQEALTNVAKHAPGASRVKVRLRLAVWSLRLRIEDDGPGLCAAPALGRRSPRGPNGIVGMCERLAEVGGELEIRRLRQKGTCVLITIPLRKGASQALGNR
ncbi:sensor histidine kinase [Chelativorans salis]|uniref:histidine kinase n=1 Tax=Chelativorans salis TaxID=2978478 RepID=A0ABT2LRF3_9HYPH|nr:sensor histidine kinase [Chelativorans sp. EGI FJ00035]MCT7376936.1 sensor histidine kinase [Chelativorans sp. EGI FJ00035]